MKIIFENGILGFEDYRIYKIVNIEQNPIFKEMISKKEENVGFIVVSPFDIDENYDINLDKATIDELEIEDSKDLMIYNIVTLNETIETSTVNMRAPIIVNVNNNLAKQIILQNENYEIKHPIIRGE